MTNRFDYSKIDVVEFLSSLGVQNIRDQGLEVLYSCPFDHARGDVNPSASMSKVSVMKDNGDEYPPTTYHCFGCGKAGNAVTFLAEYEGVSNLNARQLLREKFGMSFKEPEGSVLSEVMNILEPPKKEVKEEDWMQPEISKEDLDYRRVNWTDHFGDVPIKHKKYMLDRGFSPEILTKFDIGYDPISDRISIPVYDELNRLIGFKGRSWDGKLPKYIVLGGERYRFEPYNVSKVLFGFWRAVRTDLFLEARRLYVVEGELNTLAMVDKGFDNSVGISGQFISDRQAALLFGACRSVTLVFDEHDKALTAADKLHKHVHVSIAPFLGKDPAESTEDELNERLYRTKTPLLLQLEMSRTTENNEREE